MRSYILIYGLFEKGTLRHQFDEYLESMICDRPEEIKCSEVYHFRFECSEVRAAFKGQDIDTYVVCRIIQPWDADLIEEVKQNLGIYGSQQPQSVAIMSLLIHADINGIQKMHTLYTTLEKVCSDEQENLALLINSALVQEALGFCIEEVERELPGEMGDLSAS